MNAAPIPLGKDVPNLDPLAQAYRWMEWLTFGPYLHRCRRTYLSDLTTARRALVLGDGDGRFTAELLRANPHVQIDAVDASQAMLRTLLRRAKTDAHRVQTHAADIRTWAHEQARNQKTSPTEPYDLVIAHFFFDFLTTEEIRALTADLRPRLAPNARWIVSEFAQPNGLYGKLIAAPVIWLLYRSFALLTGLRIRRLPNHAAALRESGFTLETSRTLLNGLLIAEDWRL
jgi:SAM-dependent methyltransferase